MKTGRSGIALLIKTVHQAIRTDLDRRLRARGLALPQVAVLVRLKHSAGVSNAELARGAFVSPQSMAEVLEGLLDKGWIVRRVAPDNARVLRTTLTRKGLERMRAGATEIAAVEARVAAAFDPSEYAALRKMLERCAAALGAPLQSSRRARKTS